MIKADRFGDAAASDVLAGKTFTSVNGLKLTGSFDGFPRLKCHSTYGSYWGSVSYLGCTYYDFKTNGLHASSVKEMTYDDSMVDFLKVIINTDIYIRLLKYNKDNDITLSDIGRIAAGTACNVNAGESFSTDELIDFYSDKYVGSIAMKINGFYMSYTVSSVNITFTTPGVVNTGSYYEEVIITAGDGIKECSLTLEIYLKNRDTSKYTVLIGYD